MPVGDGRQRGRQCRQRPDDHPRSSRRRIGGGDNGNVFIADRFHNSEGATPNITMPAGGGLLVKATVLNDDDFEPESVDLLVLRPNGDGSYEVIHRVTITDDTPDATDSATTDYPLPALAA